MTAPAVVRELVERFANQQNSYRSGHYNETQLRREFLDPFFESLGWDVYNRKGYAEAYKEVIHEDAIRIGGRTKAPDYCFRAGGGIRSFFVEAKKPSVDIRDATSPAYQLRRYAWSAKLPISILTDFGELAVYDCRVRPERTDRASVGRVAHFQFAEYLDRWNELFELFSPEAIRRGSLEKFVASNKIKKGTAEVDVAFLDEIESWRDVLARNLALRNPGITQRDLNFAVQRTIDRIIFLRICEDRGIEPYGRLQDLANGPNIYRRLGELFQRADERYNSGLFFFSAEQDRDEPPDEMTLGLTIDDKTLKEILRNLYYPDSPYEFAVLPAAILGQVYEQFLGKVIRLTKGGQARVEEKPEVRKAGGVFYTPAYIVDYITHNTIGRLLDGFGPREASRIRVVDPACGSGSFLIGAYQYLLDWHRDRYVEIGPERHSRGRHPVLYRGAGGQWRLTTAEKKRILLNSIYGVDIDPQAVEVTKLSLLLKVLEGESEETITNQLRLFHERALPDLASNIKCGNSLIGTDFYEGRQLDLLDEDRYSINAFDWRTEFCDVFQGGGFDAVVGNPPYVRMEAFKPIKEYLRSHYRAHEERADLYAYFVEKAIDLLKPTGLTGMIVSNKFAKAKYGKPLRQVLDSSAAIDTIADFAGARVFQGATVRTLVLIARSSEGGRKGDVRYVPVPSRDTMKDLASGLLPVDAYARQSSYSLARNALGPKGWRFISKSGSSLLEKLTKDTIPLAKWVGSKAIFGIKTGLNEAFIVDETTRLAILAEDARSTKLLKPILFGRDVRRYETRPAGRYVVYCHPDVDVADYPVIERHLLPFRKRLMDRAGKQKWYELQQPAVAILPHLRKPKIVYPIIANECRFAIDHDEFFVNDKMFVLPTRDLALLAILNSRIANFYFSSICAALEGEADRYLEFRAQYVDAFPVASRLTQGDARESLASLGKQAAALHARLAAVKTAVDKTLLQRQIDATDRQIDSLVYGIYGLTDKEIAVVEEMQK